MPDLPVYNHVRLAMIKTLVFLLPFSVESEVFAGTMLRIPTEPIIGLLALIFVVDIWKHPSAFKWPVIKEFLWLLPLAASFAISLIFTAIPFVSVKFTAVNLMYIIVFYLLLMQVFKRHPLLYLQLLFLYGLGMLLVFFLAMYRYGQYEWNPVVIRGIFQPFFNDHTIYGASAALLAIFWTSMVIMSTDKQTRLTGMLLAPLFIAIVIVTTSRAAFLSLFVAAVFFSLFWLRLHVRHILLLLLATGLVVWMVSPLIVEQIRRIETVSYDPHAGLLERTGSAVNVTTDVSNRERLNRWVSAWRMFRDKPLTGFGPGTYQFEYIPYQEPGLMNRLSVTNPHEVPEGSGGTAHSEYLLALSEMGVLGLVGWLVLLGRWTWVAFDRQKDRNRSLYAIVAFPALTTYMFHAFFNNFLTTDKFAFLFWGTAAWLVAGYHNTKEDENRLLPES